MTTWTASHGLRTFGADHSNPAERRSLQVQTPCDLPGSLPPQKGACPQTRPRRFAAARPSRSSPGAQNRLRLKAGRPLPTIGGGGGSGLNGDPGNPVCGLWVGWAAPFLVSPAAPIFWPQFSFCHWRNSAFVLCHCQVRRVAPSLPFLCRPVDV